MGWSLSDGTSVFSFSPSFSFRDTAKRNVQRNDTQAGYTGQYIWSGWGEFSFPLTRVNSAGVALLRGWFRDDAILSLSSATQTTTVAISGGTFPLSRFVPYDSAYRSGVLKLEEA